MALVFRHLSSQLIFSATRHDVEVPSTYILTWECIRPKKIFTCKNSVQCLMSSVQEALDSSTSGQME